MHSGAIFVCRIEQWVSVIREVSAGVSLSADNHGSTKSCQILSGVPVHPRESDGGLWCRKPLCVAYVC